MTSDYTFRYPDTSLPVPYAVGLNHAFIDAGLRLEFFDNDPTRQADFVVLQRVIIDPTAMVDLIAQIQKRYELPPESSQE